MMEFYDIKADVFCSVYLIMGVKKCPHRILVEQH